MKKNFIAFAVIVAAIFFIGCASTSQVAEQPLDISQYYAVPDKECDFILEFENKSEDTLTINNCIINKNKRKSFMPKAKSEDIVLAEGESVKLRFNTSDMIKDFSSMSVGFYCYEKNWYWWYDINPQMNQNHIQPICMG